MLYLNCITTNKLKWYLKFELKFHSKTSDEISLENIVKCHKKKNNKISLNSIIEIILKCFGYKCN